MPNKILKKNIKKIKNIKINKADVKKIVDLAKSANSIYKQVKNKQK